MFEEMWEVSAYLLRSVLWGKDSSYLTTGVDMQKSSAYQPPL